VPGLPGYEQGLFQVQDEAAQLVCNLLAPFSAGNYLDGCAGLGGKTMHLAQLMVDTAILAAVEPSAGRIAMFRENIQRLQLPRIEIYEGTLQAFCQQTPEKFQGILLDAPCSGLGVIRRHPEIRWSRAKKDLDRYQAIQRELLTCAAPLVVEGGVLVYATCSIDPKENEEVVTSFLNDFPQFKLSDPREFLPDEARVLVDDCGFFKTTPEQGLDGFFAARLQRISGN
ncbi:MAG: RsmB/NOP family class I SAM-dependent RNA methyltransferase, partial [Desulfobulbaceae bacterium]|nr:RsmB/NOP family class I SAM-dependent RNA methyltransferase [Desulfobulbaceae bacterium]